MHSAITALLAWMAVVLAIFVTWRYASRRWALPCPSLVGWALESPFYFWLTGTQKTLDRIGVQPGQRVLEIGPGPGRILIPLARRVGPQGEAVGVDIQAGMVKRLQRRVEREGVTNVTAIHADATQPVVPPENFDVVVLVTTLGEIPDRAAVLAQCYRALKPGGVLSITEMLPDPHYQSKATIRRLVAAAGFEPPDFQGSAWLFTASARKPANDSVRSTRGTMS